MMDHCQQRTLGIFTCLALGLTTIVGSGIFALPPVLARTVGPASFLPFLAAAVVVSLLGLMTAEAAGTTSEPGGAYQYASTAFGPKVGFAVAWLAWANAILAWATVSLALVKLLDVLAPGLGSGRLAQGIATAQIVFFCVLNLRGVRAGATVSNILTVTKLVPLFLFAVVGLLVGVLIHKGSAFANALPQLQAAGASGFAVATYRCIFAAGGFENIAVVAGEVKDPKRAIPRAVLLSIASSTVLYLLVQLAAVASIPDLANIAKAGMPGSLALPLGAERAGSEMCGPSCGRVFYLVLLIGAVISMTGYCAGVAIVAPRYVLAMARGGFLPMQLARLSPGGNPAPAVLVTTALAIVAVWSASWLALLDAAILFSLGQHLCTTLAAYRLRSLIPTQGRFVSPFGHVVPFFAVGSVVVLCALAFRPGPDQVGLGHFVALFVLLLAGGLVAALSRRAN